MVNMYSSAQFYKDWRYSIEKDFTDLETGEPVSYAKDGHRVWDDESHKIQLSNPASQISVNCDHSLIAVAIEDDIHIYDASSFLEVQALKGHISRIDAIAFQPGNPKVLVSAAQNNHAGSVPTKPTIIFWDLDQQKSEPSLDASDITGIANHTAATIARQISHIQPKLNLSIAEQKEISDAVEPIIIRSVRSHLLAERTTLNGRLCTHFQSEVFSPTGSHLLYLPGPRPKSNSSDIWNVKVYSMADHEDVLTLVGHSDAIMWHGYSPDQQLIATVAWDRTMRIWDSNTGEQKHKFDTEGQNWTGAFSSDSSMFAGTCGDGSLYVYSMMDGSTLVHYKPETNASWKRALSWSDDGSLLAVGGRNYGVLYVYDMVKKMVVQERKLSTEKCDVEDRRRKTLGGFLEVNAVKFVDKGRKVVTLTSGDWGIETYDLVNGEKWRFARPGVDPEDISKEEGEEGKAESIQQESQEIPEVKGSWCIEVWEDKDADKIWIAGLNGDTVRIWRLPASESEEASLQ